MYIIRDPYSLCKLNVLHVYSPLSESKKGYWSLYLNLLHYEDTWKGIVIQGAF